MAGKKAKNLRQRHFQVPLHSQHALMEHTTVKSIVGELEELFAKQAKALASKEKRCGLSRKDQTAYQKRKRRIEALRSELESLSRTTRLN